jgi:hypothetical protein
MHVAFFCILLSIANYWKLSYCEVILCWLLHTPCSPSAPCLSHDHLQCLSRLWKMTTAIADDHLHGTTSVQDRSICCMVGYTEGGHKLLMHCLSSQTNRHYGNQISLQPISYVFVVTDEQTPWKSDLTSSMANQLHARRWQWTDTTGIRLVNWSDCPGGHHHCHSVVMVKLVLKSSVSSNEMIYKKNKLTYDPRDQDLSWPFFSSFPPATPL